MFKKIKNKIRKMFCIDIYHTSPIYIKDDNYRRTQALNKQEKVFTIIILVIAILFIIGHVYG